jgi:hypothetical protein
LGLRAEVDALAAPLGAGARSFCSTALWPKLPPGPPKTVPAHPKRQKAREHLEFAATMYRQTNIGFWLEAAEAELIARKR